MLRFYLFRHGPTQWNIEGRYSGRQDIDLAPDGVALSKQWHRLILPIPFRIFYSSPLKRALQTARLLIGLRPIPISTDDRLIELDFGRWEGRTFRTVRESDPETYRAWRENPLTHGPPDGETLTDVSRRMADFLRELDHSGGTIGIVSHVTPLKVLSALLLNLPVTALLRFYLAPGGLIVIDRLSSGNAILRTFNLLPEPGPFLHHLTHETF